MTLNIKMFHLIIKCLRNVKKKYEKYSWYPILKYSIYVWACSPFKFLTGKLIVILLYSFLGLEVEKECFPRDLVLNLSLVIEFHNGIKTSKKITRKLFYYSFRLLYIVRLRYLIQSIFKNWLYIWNGNGIISKYIYKYK